MMMMIALDQHVYCRCAKSLKQQFVNRNIAQLESTILIPNKIVFALLFFNSACLAYRFYDLWFDTAETRTHDLPHSQRAS